MKTWTPDLQVVTRLFITKHTHRAELTKIWPLSWMYVWMDVCMARICITSEEQTGYDSIQHF